MRLWGKDEERGALLGAIAAIILFTFVFPDPDVDLGVVFPGNPPYGYLWYLLNPLYWTKKIYPIIVFIEWAIVTLIEWKVLKNNRGLVKLQIFSTMFLMMLHAQQDVTVIMFAPLAILNLGFIGLEILQKIPFPWTQQWQCAFYGTGTDANAYQFPCLANSTHFLTFSHVYALTYIVLVFWAVFPLVIWFKSGPVKTSLLPVVGGRVWKFWCPCWIGKKCTKDVERGGEESSIVVTPTIRKQPSPSPTKSVSRLDVLLLLTLGIIAHDVASIEGFHIPGYHAVYFAIPMVLVILSIKFGRRIRKWQKK
jgi:hypothetical protein